MPSSAATQRRRRQLKAYGRWSAPVLLDAAPAAAHLAHLRGYGLSTLALAQLTGVSDAVVKKLTEIERTSAPGQVTARTDRLVRAAAFDLRALDRTHLVASAGTERRLQALPHAGWPLSQVAARLGVTPAAISHYTSGSRTTVTVEVALAVAAAFEDWAYVPGPSPHAAKIARTRGWLGALSWAGADIDDPRSEPEIDPAPLTAAEHAQALALVRQYGITYAAAVRGLLARRKNPPRRLYERRSA